MARRIEATVDGVLYEGDTSPARDQVEMLNIASRYNLLPTVRDNMGDMAIVAVIATLDMSLIERLKVLCIGNGKVIRGEDKVPVSENLFQDRPHLFLLLIGRILKENIGSFWLLSSTEKNQPKEPMEPMLE